MIDFKAQRQHAKLEMYVRAYSATSADVAACRQPRGTPQQRRLARLHRMQTQRRATRAALARVRA